MRILLLFLLMAIAGPAMGQLRFETHKVQFGTISEDDAPREFVFGYVNESDKPVVITRVETTCGCARPGYAKEPVMPGAKGTVTITFNPKGQPGATAKSIYVYTSGSNSPMKLSIVGAVDPTKDPHPEYPHRIGALRLKQTEVRFGAVRAPMRAMARIEVVNEGTRALRLSVSAAPAWLKFSTEPAVILPDSVGDLVFVCDPEGLERGEKIEDEVILDGVVALPSARIIKISGEVR